MMGERRRKTNWHTSEKRKVKALQAAQRSAALIVNSSHVGEAWKESVDLLWPLSIFRSHKIAKQ